MSDPNNNDELINDDFDGLRPIGFNDQNQEPLSEPPGFSDIPLTQDDYMEPRFSSDKVSDDLIDIGQNLNQAQQTQPNVDTSDSNTNSYVYDNLNTALGGLSQDYSKMGPDVLFQPESVISYSDKQLLLERISQAKPEVQDKFFQPWVNSKGWVDKKKVKAAENQINSEQHTVFENALNDINNSDRNPETIKAPYLGSTTGHGFKNSDIYPSMVYGLDKKDFVKEQLLSGYSIALPTAERVEGKLQPTKPVIVPSNRYALRPVEPNSENAQQFYKAREADIKSKIPELEKEHDLSKQSVADRVYKITDDSKLYLGEDGQGLSKNIAAAMADDERLRTSFEAVNLGATKEFKLDEDDPHTNLYLKEQNKTVYGLKSLDGIEAENLPDNEELNQIELEKTFMVREFEEANSPMPFDVSTIRDIPAEEKALSEGKNLDDLNNNAISFIEPVLDNKDDSKNLDSTKPIEDKSLNTTESKSESTEKNDTNTPNKRNRRNANQPPTGEITNQSKQDGPKVKEVPNSDELVKDTKAKAPKVDGAQQPNLISQAANKAIQLAIMLAKLIMEVLRALMALLLNRSKQAAFATAAALDRRRGRDDFTNRTRAEQSADNARNVKMDFSFLDNKGKTYGAANMPSGYPTAGPKGESECNTEADKSNTQSYKADAVNTSGIASEYNDFLNNNLDPQNAYKPNGERYLSLTSTEDVDAEKYTDSILSNGEKNLLLLGKQVYGNDGNKLDEPNLIVVDLDKVEKVPLTMSDINVFSEVMPAKETLDKFTHMIEQSGALPTEYMSKTSIYRDKPEDLFKVYPNSSAGKLQMPVSRETYTDRIGKVLENHLGNPEIVVGLSQSIDRKGSGFTHGSPKIHVVDMEVAQAMGNNIPLESLKGLPIREVEMSHFSGKVISDFGVNNGLKQSLIDTQLNNLDIQKNGIGVELADIKTIAKNILESAKDTPVLALTGQRLLIDDSKRNSNDQQNLASAQNAVEQSNQISELNSNLDQLFKNNPELRSVVSESGLDSDDGSNIYESTEPTRPMFANRAELMRYRDELNNRPSVKQQYVDMNDLPDNVIPLHRTEANTSSEETPLDGVTSTLLDQIKESKAKVKTINLNNQLVTREHMKLQDSEITSIEVLGTLNNKNDTNTPSSEFETQIRSIALAKTALNKKVEYTPEQLKALQESMIITQDNQMSKLEQQVKVMPNGAESSFNNPSAIKPNQEVRGDFEVFKQLITNEPIDKFKDRITAGMNQFAPATDEHRQNAEVCKNLIQMRIDAETSLAAFKTSELAIKPDVSFETKLDTEQQAFNQNLRTEFGNSDHKINDKVMVYNQNSRINEPATVLGRYAFEENGKTEERLLVGDTLAAGIVINQRSAKLDQVTNLNEKGQLSLNQIKHFENVNANTVSALTIESNKPTVQIPQYSSLTAEERIKNIMQTIKHPDKEPGNAFACELADMKSETDKNIVAFLELQKNIKANPAMQDFEMTVDAALNKEQKQLVYQTIAVEDPKTGINNYHSQINFDALNMVREANLDKPALNYALDFNKHLKESNNVELQGQIIELGRITRNIAHTTSDQESIKLDLASVSVERNQVGLTSNDIKALSEQVSNNIVENRHILPALQSSVAQYAPIAKDHLENARNSNLSSNQDLESKDPSFMDKMKSSLKQASENLFSSFRKNDSNNQKKFDELSQTVEKTNSKNIDADKTSNKENDSTYGNSM